MMAAMSRYRSILGRAAPPARALRRRLDRAAAAWGERSARRLAPGFSHAIRLDHPPSADPRPRYGAGRPFHPELEHILESSTDRYREALESFAPFSDDLARFPREDHDSPEPCWFHPWLIGLDTVSLYAFTRLGKPARYVEVGSGQSTKVVARARRDGGLETKITSIDPQPRQEVDALCDRVVRSALEEVDLADCFGGLQAGDIVFFDGSHRVMPNSDCVAFFLDVLPFLPPDVLVGVHDVYLPADYPEPELWWSEQYMLAAFLLADAPWLEVVLPAYYATGRPELAALVAPFFARPELAEVNPRGSVFWIRTRPSDRLTSSMALP